MSFTTKYTQLFDLWMKPFIQVKYCSVSSWCVYSWNITLWDFHMCCKTTFIINQELISFLHFWWKVIKRLNKWIHAQWFFISCRFVLLKEWNCNDQIYVGKYVGGYVRLVNVHNWSCDVKFSPCMWAISWMWAFLSGLFKRDN